MRREEAASESIGTILILAITITGIGIVAALLLGNVSTEEIPQFDIAIVNETNEEGVSLQQLTIHHTSGDAIDPGEMRILVNDEDATDNAYLSEDSPPWIYGSTPFGLGKSLKVYSDEVPRNLKLVYEGGSAKELIVESSSFTTRQNYPQSAGPRPPDWHDDVTPPQISNVHLNPIGSPYNVGADVTISWTASDNVQLKGAMIEYCADGCSVLTSLTSATKPYAWTIPDDMGTGRNIKVTVYDINGNSASDNSDDFEITDDAPPQVTITKPASGDSYKTGDPMDITWTATDNRGVESVTIIAVIPGFGEIEIASGIANSGSYTWTIPDNDSLRTTSATIRVEAIDEEDNTGTGISGSFTIGESTNPIVTIQSPTSGSSYEAGDLVNIIWTATDNIAVTSIDLAYSVNGGTWKVIATGLSNTESYSWTVPDDPSTNVQIRVTAHDEDKNKGEKESDSFTITTPPGAEVISLFLFYPDGGEPLTPGDPYTIQWKASTTDPYHITTIDLAYSTDNGNTWKSIANGESNDEQYSWVVPIDPTSQGRVRVTAHSDSGQSRTAMSSGSFTIQNPELTVVLHTPNGNEEWNIGTVYQITWTAEDPDGTTGISDITLAYSLDDGETWTAIGSGIPNTGTYDWTTPTSGSTQARVRVTATGIYMDTKSDTSNAAFTIYNIPPVVEVIAPNGGESWTLGSQQSITWTASDSHDIQSVSIWYSPDRGATYTLIDTVSNSGSYDWTVPGPATTTGVIKITATDTQGASEYDISDSVFSVISAPSLVTVTTPNGGESYTVGDEATISWTVTQPGIITSFDLAYTTSDSGTPVSIVTGLPNTDRSYSWTVPDTPSTQTRVHVTAYTSGGTESDKSNGYFTIASPTGETITLFLFYPDGGEMLTPGSTFPITWYASVSGGGSIAGIDLAFSADNGGSFTDIITNTVNTGTYSWTVPSQSTSQGRVRVTAHSEAGTSASVVSTDAFTISDPASTVTLYTPNGGEVLDIGSGYEITWFADDPEGISSVALDYSADNGATWASIASGIANTGSFSWTLPTAETTSGRIRVTATDTHGNPTSDMSNAPFTITNTPPEVRITSPNGGESWSAGSTHAITWTATDPDGVASIVISYRTSESADWTDIATVSNTPASYTWTIPSSATSAARVRITATDSLGKSASDISDAVFSITLPQPVVTVTSPNGGENYATGSIQTISWTATNPSSITSIDIEYNINDSSIPKEITTGLSSTATSYSWTVPNNPSTKVKVIVKVHTSSGIVTDGSDNFFIISDNIPPTITIIEPHDGVRFKPYIKYVTNPERIEWSASDNIAVVRVYLEYSTDGGNEWHDIIDYLSNNGYYYWFVPQRDSSDCIVRGTAFDVAGNSAQDESDGRFTIRS